MLLIHWLQLTHKHLQLLFTRVSIKWRSRHVEGWRQTDAVMCSLTPPVFSEHKPDFTLWLNSQLLKLKPLSLYWTCWFFVLCPLQLFVFNPHQLSSYAFMMERAEALFLIFHYCSVLIFFIIVLWKSVFMEIKSNSSRFWLGSRKKQKSLISCLCPVTFIQMETLKRRWEHKLLKPSGLFTL